MSGDARPPRAAVCLSRVAAPPEDRAQILGDLQERYSRRLASRGVRAANRWYWFQALGLTAVLIPRRILYAVPRLAAPGTLRAAFRAVLRSPRESTLAAITLAIGIAAPSAMFALADGTTRSLPGDPADQVVSVSLVDQTGRSRMVMPWEFFEVWRASASGPGHAMSSLAAYRSSGRVAVGGGEAYASRYRGAYATAGLFDLLNVSPVAGRLYREGESYGGLPAVLIREDVWEERFDRDSDAIGKVLRVDGGDHMVLGVLPRTFGFPSNERIWIQPSRMETQSWAVVGRLSDAGTSGVAREQLAAALATAGPGDESSPPHVRVERYTEAYFGGQDDTARRVGMVSLLLVLTTAVNVASIMLARGISRSRETATRLAIGATRGQVIVLTLTEVLLLALGGAVLGVFLGRLALQGMVDYLTSQAVVVPYWMDFGLGPRSIVIAAMLTLLALVVAGGVPAARSSRAESGGALRANPHEGPWGRGRLMAGVVGFEIALSCVLLSVSSSLVEESAQILRSPTDFPTEDVRTGQLILGAADYPDAGARGAFLTRLSAVLRSDAAVREVSLASALPGKEGLIDRVSVVGLDSDLDKAPPAQVRMVDAGFFSMLGLRAAAGRLLSDEDRADAEPVCVVNRPFARDRRIEDDAVGRKLVVGHAQDGEAFTATIVGVVDDAGATPFMRGQPSPGVYLSLSQLPPRGTYLMVKTQEGVPLLQLWHDTGATLDRYLPLGEVMSLDEALRRGHGAASLYLSVFLGLGAASLLVALVGLHGSQSFLVARRMREIGVRRALGADSGHVMRQSMLKGLRPVWAGLLLGVPPGFLAARSVVPVTPNPLIYALPPLLLVVASVIALWGPTRRASRADPMDALRDG